MKDRILYRYTTEGEGVFSAGKRLLPEHLIDEVIEAKKWLDKPDLKPGNYRFWLTEEGKKMYDNTLIHSHKKYLKEIKMESIHFSELKKVVFEDKYQIVEAFD